MQAKRAAEEKEGSLSKRVCKNNNNNNDNNNYNNAAHMLQTLPAPLLDLILVYFQPQLKELCQICEVLELRLVDRFLSVAVARYVSATVHTILIPEGLSLSNVHGMCQQLPQLQTIEGSANLPLGAMSALKSLQHLRSVDWDWYDSGTNILDVLAQLPKSISALTGPGITGWVNAMNTPLLYSIPKCTNLTELQVHKDEDAFRCHYLYFREGMTKEKIKFPPATVTHLDLAKVTVMFAFSCVLLAMPHLHSLQLSEVHGFQQATPELLKWFQGFHNLRKFQCQSTQVAPELLEAMNVANLETLRLSFAGVKFDMSAVSGLIRRAEKLKVVEFPDTVLDALLTSDLPAKPTRITEMIIFPTRKHNTTVTEAHKQHIREHFPAVNIISIVESYNMFAVDLIPSFTHLKKLTIGYGYQTAEQQQKLSQIVSDLPCLWKLELHARGLLMARLQISSNSLRNIFVGWAYLEGITINCPNLEKFSTESAHQSDWSIQFVNCSKLQTLCLPYTYNFSPVLSLISTLPSLRVVRTSAVPTKTTTATSATATTTGAATITATTATEAFRNSVDTTSSELQMLAQQHPRPITVIDFGDVPFDRINLTRHVEDIRKLLLPQQWHFSQLTPTQQQRVQQLAHHKRQHESRFVFFPKRNYSNNSDNSDNSSGDSHKLCNYDIVTDIRMDLRDVPDDLRVAFSHAQSGWYGNDSLVIAVVESKHRLSDTASQSGLHVSHTPTNRND